MNWNSKTLIAVAAVALVLVLGASGVLLFHWLWIPHRDMDARTERDVTAGLDTPLELVTHLHTTTSEFSQITRFPAWQFVPTGLQIFCNVPLQIDGQICLYGEGNAKNGLKFPETCAGISMNLKLETLYIYHAAFFASPKGTPVYGVVFRYEDGTSATNLIRYGDDVLDWYANGRQQAAGPTDARSKLAWQGVADLGTKQQPLRFCLTAVENPFPAITVTAVDLYSCKSQSAACILAMTPGHSGLMQ